MKHLLWIPVFLLGLAGGAASASMLLQEDFSYDPGTLLSATGNWAPHSGTGTNPIAVTDGGLDYSGYPGSGSGNAATMTTSGEDDHTTATMSVTSGSIYMAFLANFSNAQSGDYFAHFYQTSSQFYGRVFAKLVSGSLNFGVTRGSGTANYSSVPFDLGTTHLIVVKYTFVDGTLNDTAELFVNPVISPVEPAPLVSATDTGSTDANNIIGISLRQGSGSAAPTQWVDGFRVATSWAEAVAGIAAGACCLEDGTCSLTIEADCFGTWHGEWTTCAPNPCPQPPGACCFEDGSCVYVAENECEGAWQGAGTACDPNPCPQPNGACCYAGGICVLTSEVECLAGGGTWLGTEIGCDPNPCEVPIGACCAPDGSCAMVPEAGCEPPSVWHPEWTTCAPNPCPQPQGACCLEDGSCTFVTVAECAGDWHGFGSTCDPNPCPPPSGACCFEDGTCTFVTEADCGGVWLGYGTTCDPNPCQQPGACCFEDGTCQVLSRVLCQQAGGDYIGDGISCSPYPCPPLEVTICDVAEDDENGLPVLNGRLVVVEGVSLVNSGTWSPTTQEFQITDGECCVDVFGGSINPSVQIGDRVRVTGTVADYSGKTEITSPGLTVTILSQGNPVPPPTFITTGELAANGEPYESCYFGLRCVRVVGGDPWPADGSNANVLIDDGTGPVQMRIDRDTDVDGSPEPQGEFTVVGIGDQFNQNYQIKPRSLADLIFDCGEPTGACCFEEGICQVATADSCGTAGGYFQGIDIPCEPNPCLLHVGACCYEHGICEVQPDYICAANGGFFIGDGSTCAPNPCPSGDGACCFENGVCELLPVTPCEFSGGVWLGEGVPCDPNPCQQPQGACCAPDGACTVTEQSGCQPPNVWQGPDTVCDPNPCPIPVGACCFASGECQVLTRVLCEQQDGAYQGDNTVCDPNPCLPPNPTEKTSWGRIKQQYN